MNEIICARKTERTPAPAPRKPPAMGPMNWKNVNDWFYAPRTCEKLRLLAARAIAVNSSRNARPLAESTFSILIFPPRFRLVVLPVQKTFYYIRGIDLKPFAGSRRLPLTG